MHAGLPLRWIVAGNAHARCGQPGRGKQGSDRGHRAWHDPRPRVLGQQATHQGIAFDQGLGRMLPSLSGSQVSLSRGVDSSTLHHLKLHFATQHLRQGLGQAILVHVATEAGARHLQVPEAQRAFLPLRHALRLHRQLSHQSRDQTLALHLRHQFRPSVGQGVGWQFGQLASQ